MYDIQVCLSVSEEIDELGVHGRILLEKLKVKNLPIVGNEVWHRHLSSRWQEIEKTEAFPEKFVVKNIIHDLETDINIIYVSVSNISLQ